MFKKIIGISLLTASMLIAQDFKIEDVEGVQNFTITNTDIDFDKENSIWKSSYETDYTTTANLLYLQSETEFNNGINLILEGNLKLDKTINPLPKNILGYDNQYLNFLMFDNRAEKIVLNNLINIQNNADFDINVSFEDINNVKEFTLIEILYIAPANPINHLTFINNNNIKINANTDEILISSVNNYSSGNGSRSFFNAGTIEALVNNKLSSNAYSYIHNGYKTNLTNLYNAKMVGNISILNGYLINKGYIELPIYLSNNFNTNFGAMNRFTQINILDNEPGSILKIEAFKDSNGEIFNTKILTNAAYFNDSLIYVNVLENSSPFLLNDRLESVVYSRNELSVNNLKIEEFVDSLKTPMLEFGYEVVNNNKQLDIVVTKVNKINEIIDENGDIGEIIDPTTPTEPIEEEEKKKAEEEAKKKAEEEEEAKKKAEQQKLKKTIAALQKLKTQEEIEKAVDSLNPYIHTNMFDFAKTTNNNVNSILENVNKNNDSFVKIFSGKATQKNEYKHDFTGVGLGFNKEYKEKQYYTIGAFYTNSKAELKRDLNQTAEIDTYSLTIAGENNLKNNYYINYNLIYSFNKVETKRELFTRETAKANFNSTSISANTEIGKEIELNKNHSLTPSLSLNYTNYNSKTYKESGAEAALKIGAKKTDELITSVGLEYKYKIGEDKTLSISPKFGYVLKEADRNYEISFVEIENQKFTRSGANNDKYVYGAKIGYEQDVTKNQNLGASFEYIKHKNYESNNISFNYKLKF
ncbi:MAG: autotransporter outer membrane beta-barrel domain-containing protein [Arcobacteraceae bacterium]|jgi:hypothetical protein|nr:autotransporter outer membrane beta-barrel domain-containing protein [Arcobacteraceae bacterium]